MSLADPERRFIPAIARYGLDATLEAIAIFKARQTAGTAPTDFLERYLLGIARNVAHRNLEQAVYDALLRLRLLANDHLLQPLVGEKQELSATLSLSDFALAALTRALSTKPTIDRTFWRGVFIESLDALPSNRKEGLAGYAARRVARAFSVPVRERDHFIAALAASVRPIPPVPASERRAS